MDGRIITVFGGGGFIGRYVVRRLAAAGARVRVAVPNPSAALFLTVAGVPGQVVPVRADVRDADSVQAALKGSDGAVLTVGLLAESGRKRFVDYHVSAADLVARGCQAAGIAQAVLISALGADVRSRSRYARTKALGEAAFRAALPGGVILRPSVVFGNEDRFFNRLAGLAKFGAVPLIGGGSTPLQPVYVHDVAEAVLQGFAPERAGQTYAIGGPRVITFAECARLAAEYAGRRIWPVPLPFAVAEVAGFVLGALPGAPFTYDQVLLLQQANTVPAGAAGLAELGIVPTPVEAVLPEQLRRFRTDSAYDLGRGLDRKNSRYA